jgi:hypothetical protein
MARRKGGRDEVQRKTRKSERVYKDRQKIAHLVNAPAYLPASAPEAQSDEVESQKVCE